MTMHVHSVVTCARLLSVAQPPLWYIYTGLTDGRTDGLVLA